MFFIAGGGEEDQREATLFTVMATQFYEPQQIAVESERIVNIVDAYHRMQVFHATIFAYAGHSHNNARSR